MTGLLDCCQSGEGPGDDSPIKFLCAFFKLPEGIIEKCVQNKIEEVFPVEQVALSMETGGMLKEMEQTLMLTK